MPNKSRALKWNLLLHILDHRKTASCPVSLLKMCLPRSPSFLPDEQSFVRCCVLITGFQNDECAPPLQASSTLSRILQKFLAHHFGWWLEKAKSTCMSLSCVSALHVYPESFADLWMATWYYLAMLRNNETMFLWRPSRVHKCSPHLFH